MSKVFRGLSRKHVRQSSGNELLNDAGSSDDDVETYSSAQSKPSISKALDALQSAAMEKKKPKKAKKLNKITKKPRKLALNALLPPYFLGKKFNYRTSMEMLPNGWLLAKYNKTGGFLMLDPESTRDDAVHTIQHPSPCKAIATQFPYVVSYHSGDKGDVLVFYNVDQRQSIVHELWSEEDPKRPSKILLFCNNVRCIHFLYTYCLQSPSLPRSFFSLAWLSSRLSRSMSCHISAWARRTRCANCLSRALCARRSSICPSLLATVCC